MKNIFNTYVPEIISRALGAGCGWDRSL